MCLYWGEDWVWTHCYKAQIGGVLQWCLSFCRFLLHIWSCSSTRATIRFLVTTPIKALLHHLLSLASSRKSPGCFKLVQLRVTETTCFCDPLMKQNLFLNSSPDVWLDTNLFLSSTDNYFELRAWFLLWYALSAIRPFIKMVCVSKSYPFHWIHHRLPSLKSSDIYKQYECS